FCDELSQRREQSPQVCRLLLRLVQAPEQGRELAGRDGAAVRDLACQPVDAVFEAKTLGVELQRARIALGQRRLDLAPRASGATLAAVDERTAALPTLPVVR